MSPAPAWYLRRLAAMSPLEVGYRLEQRFKIAQERYWARQGERRTERVTRADFDHFQEEKTPFFFNWQDRPLYQQTVDSEFKAGLVAARRSADRIAEHDFELFGQTCRYAPDRVDWHRDPRSRWSWPCDFWADIDTRDGQTIGGVKWVWELNRHHHLVTLGKAYFISGREEYAQELCAQMLDWVHSNPRWLGVNWTSPLELAIRLINWTWALAFVRRSSALTLERFQLVQNSVVEQASHIARHLSAYSSANNHLIGEAAGLAMVGLSFPWLPQAERWRDTGLNILAAELERQIYPDGVSAEQALHYLTFVLDFNLLAWRLAELNGLTPPTIWYERLGAACEFVRHLMDERGHLPPIGDSDDAWVVRLDDRPEANNDRAILATAASLLERPEFKTAAGAWDEKSHWLLGSGGQAIFEALPASAAPPASRLFEQGGYGVMRTSGRAIVFDCGPLGYLSIAAHAHADALALTLSLEGQPLLVDPGTYAYQEGGVWRDYFRSTAAHNTLVVDGRDQSQMLGAFLWGRKARARLLGWRSNSEYDLAVAEHDGYQGVGVIHRRTVLFHKPDWLLVVDRLRGQGDHSFEQWWHLPVGGRVAPEAGRIRLTAGQKQVILVPLGTPVPKVRVWQAEENPPQGWVSPRYGVLESAPALSLSGRSSLPVELVAAFNLSSAAEETGMVDAALQLVAFSNMLEKEVM